MRGVLGVLVVAAAACSSRKVSPSSRDDAMAGAVTMEALPITDAQTTTPPPRPTPVDGPPCGPALKVENGACASDRDCVLTDVPDGCDGCNLDKPYPALRSAWDRRMKRCATTPACVSSECPPHDTYIPAFYRAECRDHRCIAWRYHGGG